MKRIRQLDGVRALAILSVFLHHSLHIKLLWMGVDLFFVLSGFLITGVLIDAKGHTLGGFFAHFYSRRAKRILPSYLLTLAAGSLVFGTMWMSHWYLYLLLTNLLLPLNIPRPVAFDPLWSLAVEEQFYLVWPFAVYFLDDRRLRQLCVGLIILAPVLRGVFHFAEHWPIYTLTPFRMDLLAAGGLLSLEWRHKKDRLQRIGTIAGLASVVCGLVGILLLERLGYSTFGNTRCGNVLIYEACLLIAVGTMLYALGSRATRWLCIKPLTYIGQISYTMYLVHLGVLTLMPNSFSKWASAVTAFAITIVYASLSWYLLESQLLKQTAWQRKPNALST